MVAYRNTFYRNLYHFVVMLVHSIKGIPSRDFCFYFLMPEPFKGTIAFEHIGRSGIIRVVTYVRVHLSCDVS